MIPGGGVREVWRWVEWAGWVLEGGWADLWQLALAPWEAYGGGFATVLGDPWLYLPSHLALAWSLGGWLLFLGVRDRPREVVTAHRLGAGALAAAAAWQVAQGRPASLLAAWLTGLPALLALRWLRWFCWLDMHGSVRT